MAHRNPFWPNYCSEEGYLFPGKLQRVFLQNTNENQEHQSQQKIYEFSAVQMKAVLNSTFHVQNAWWFLMTETNTHGFDSYHVILRNSTSTQSVFRNPDCFPFYLPHFFKGVCVSAACHEILQRLHWLHSKDARSAWSQRMSVQTLEYRFMSTKIAQNLSGGHHWKPIEDKRPPLIVCRPTRIYRVVFSCFHHFVNFGLHTRRNPSKIFDFLPDIETFRASKGVHWFAPAKNSCVHVCNL